MLVGLGVRVAVASGVTLGEGAGVRLDTTVTADCRVALGSCSAGLSAGGLNTQAEAHSAKLARMARITRFRLSRHPTNASFLPGATPSNPDLDRRPLEVNWRTEIGSDDWHAAAQSLDPF